jgi:hypothetical protein
MTNEKPVALRAVLKLIEEVERLQKAEAKLTEIRAVVKDLQGIDDGIFKSYLWRLHEVIGD